MYATWRNFKSIVRRFPLASFLNLLGLSVAFTAFMAIMMQVWHDYSFDSCQTQGYRIACMEVVNANGGRQVLVNRPIARAFVESSPHIEAGVLWSTFVENHFFYVEQGSDRYGFQETFLRASDGLMRVFDFDLVEGEASTWEEPNSVLLPQSLAKKLFGDEPAVGKLLVSQNEQEDPKVVKGVYRDFPRNCSLRNVVYENMGRENYHSNENWNYSFFVRFDDPVQIPSVVDHFKKMHGKDLFGDEFEWKELDLVFHPLPAFHFVQNISWDSLPKANPTMLWVLTLIGGLILLIAGINFMNFTTAITPMRIRSINTQKVLGSSDGALRVGLLLEAVGISFGAYLLSLLWLLYIDTNPFFTSLVEADLSIAAQPVVVGGMAILSLLVGLFAGLYPAYYITSFPPALVLKGNFGLSPTGRRMRSVLVGIQYMASFSLIIGAAFMYLQNWYMRHAPMGFDHDEVIMVGTLNTTMNKNLEAFASRLKQYSGISDVAYSQFVLGSSDMYMGWGRPYKDGKNINFQCFPVDYNFLQVMGIPVTEGRDFRPEDNLSETGYLIFNQAAKEQYALEVGDKIQSAGEIIGFMDDVKFASFRQSVGPMAFFIWGKYTWGQEHSAWYNWAAVKCKAGSDLKACMSHVQATVKEFDPEYPFTICFYDEVLQRNYEKEMKMTNLIALFSFVAICLSIVGVFGLVMFDSEYRRKEIAVRRVMGASVTEILLLFNRNYFRILLVCFVLGAPLAWFGVQRWLENFAYRIPLYWWVFPLVFLLVSLVTALTVTFQNWQVAHENPATNIKTE
ncbi:MAG: ABC transporter permease [Parabacteroides sp.]